MSHQHKVVNMHTVYPNTYHYLVGYSCSPSELSTSPNTPDALIHSVYFEAVSGDGVYLTAIYTEAFYSIHLPKALDY